MSKGYGWVRGWYVQPGHGTPGGGFLPPKSGTLRRGWLLTPSLPRVRDGMQAGSIHPTGILSC